MTPQEIANNIVWAMFKRHDHMLDVYRLFGGPVPRTPNVRIEGTQRLRDAIGVSYSYRHKNARVGHLPNLAESVAMIDAAIAAYGRGELD